MRGWGLLYLFLSYILQLAISADLQNRYRWNLYCENRYFGDEYMQNQCRIEFNELADDDNDDYNYEYGYGSLGGDLSIIQESALLRLEKDAEDSENDRLVMKRGQKCGQLYWEDSKGFERCILEQCETLIATRDSQQHGQTVYSDYCRDAAYFCNDSIPEDLNLYLSCLFDMRMVDSGALNIGDDLSTREFIQNGETFSLQSLMKQRCIKTYPYDFLSYLKCMWGSSDNADDISSYYYDDDYYYFDDKAVKYPYIASDDNEIQQYDEYPEMTTKLFFDGIVRHMYVHVASFIENCMFVLHGNNCECTRSRDCQQAALSDLRTELETSQPGRRFAPTFSTYKGLEIDEVEQNEIEKSPMNLNAQAWDEVAPSTYSSLNSLHVSSASIKKLFLRGVNDIDEAELLSK